MKHHVFAQSDTYPVALLLKSSAFNKQEIQNNYLYYLGSRGVSQDRVVALTLEYNDQGKAPVKFIKEYLEQLMPALDSLQSNLLYVADSNYFKVLTGQSKAEPHHGYVLPCKLKGYEHMNVVLGINYQALIYNPELKSKLENSLDALSGWLDGTYQPPGTGIIHSAEYPVGHEAIKEALQKLQQYPSLTCDIEAFSLRFNEAGIGTIAFAWDEHNGLAFPCDYQEEYSFVENTQNRLFHGKFTPNPLVRTLLLEFFTTYQGELTFHNAPYDVKAIIYALWMDTLLDNRGVLNGLEVMTRNMHDTKIIAYLATNSTAGNVLGLKPLAHEFAGNWAVEEIKDIRKVPLDKLLQYNLVDALSTWYVRKKHYPIMVRDNQEVLYKGLMLDSLKLIIQMELSGMPMSPKAIVETKAKLEAKQAEHLATIRGSSLIKTMNLLVQTKAMEQANAKLKTKQHPLEKFSNETFNPNSGPQLQVLLYELMGLPVLDYTDTKQPATGADTIEKLINHTQEPAYKALLEALIAYGKVTKILSTFIPAFEQGIMKADGMRYLHGSFNLGGTVSGRLSSSDPNLQNLPAGSEYGKVIKTCFKGPEGWLFCGADFSSLEDYISALTTKDPNKLAVYEKGFDGHCLRAAYYFRDQCPEIDLDDPASVNTIKKKYPQLRQDSKAPTFLLTYGGTHHGMMSNLGWDEEKSKAIEKGYHDLYKVSDEYVHARLKRASKDGYVEVAFGLRVRTPLLKQVVFGGDKVPYEAAAEGRTAGNALGQSYNLLNNRAAVDFMSKVWASKHRHDIKPVGMIHDSIYLLIKDDAETIAWANRELIVSMKWQELPEIQHPVVKLSANLDVFWPDWSNAITLQNGATAEEIQVLAKKAKEEYVKKMQSV